jgi:hypothetical protein
MKTLKNKWFWIIGIILIGIIYWKGFYKKFDASSVSKNADRVVFVDVKNCSNAVLFHYLKNPSKWSFGTGDNQNKGFNVLDCGVKISDYLAFFHIENQPENEISLVSEISDQVQFEETLLHFKFKKTAIHKSLTTYFSEELKLFLVQFSDKILVTNAVFKNQSLVIKTAEDLFLKKLFIDEEKIKNAIYTNNEMSVWLQKNNFLQEDAIANINIEEDKITANAALKIDANFITQQTFSEEKNAILSLGFNPALFANQKINFTKINKAIGFDLDSILSKKPTKTELVVNEFITKEQTAKSYDYDDDFNPIEKTIVTKSQEPSFLFEITCSQSEQIKKYLKSQKAINPENVFVNFPFAKTIASSTDSTFELEANISKKNNKKSSEKIAYFNCNLNKIQKKELNYLTHKIKYFEKLQYFSLLEMTVSKKEKNAFFEFYLKTKENQNVWHVLMSK